MNAMLLAAGRGTRLAPLTDHTPKPLLEVKGKPLIHWQLQALAKAGISRCVINLHHLGEQIEQAVGDGSRWDMEVVYSREHMLLETGGGIVQALPLLGDAPFVLMNGDIWTDFNLQTLPDKPVHAGGIHLVLTPTPAWREHGDFEFDAPQIPERGDRYVFCGIGVVDPASLEDRRAEPFSMAEVYFDLAARGLLSGQLHTGTWLDIGTREQYEAVR